MILTFSVIGAVVALVPFAKFFLIPLEVYLLYHIMRKYDAFDWMPFFGTAAMLVGISVVLKGMSTALFWLPGANSAIAFGFIYAFGTLATRYFSKRRPHGPPPAAPLIAVPSAAPLAQPTAAPPEEPVAARSEPVNIAPSPKPFASAGVKARPTPPQPPK